MKANWRFDEDGSLGDAFAAIIGYETGFAVRHVWTLTPGPGYLVETERQATSIPSR